MKRLKDILLLALLVMLIGMFLWKGKGADSDSGATAVADTVRVMVYDTIPYYKPEPKAEKLLGCVTARLPIAVPKTPESVPNSRENSENGGESVPKVERLDSQVKVSEDMDANDHIRDSTKMVAHFTNETRPGVRADGDSEGLDSQVEASKTDSADVVIPITQKVYEDSLYRAYVSGYRASLDSLIFYPRREVVTITKPPNRWHLGLSVSCGITPKGLQPQLGVSVTWSIISL